MFGAGASLTATGISITTHGNIDTSDGFAAFGAYNGIGGAAPAGGTMSLTNVTIVTTGQSAGGVAANGGGVTTSAAGR